MNESLYDFWHIINCIKATNTMATMEMVLTL